MNEYDDFDALYCGAWTEHHTDDEEEEDLDEDGFPLNDAREEA